jgi:hypothetical protein
MTNDNGHKNSKENMTNRKDVEKLAREYAEKAIPFECDDSEGMYIEEMYPFQVREATNIAWLAGYLAAEERAKVLVEALEWYNRWYHNDGRMTEVNQKFDSALKQYRGEE